MLEAQQLAAQRGSATLFTDIDFTLKPGEALLITGPNGSGKTTLLKILAGLAHPSTGALTWRGHGNALWSECACTTVYIGRGRRTN
jgi:heme exporter protein A